MKKDRSSVIVRTGLVGILTNVGLVALKAFVGLITASVSIILDALNNLTDALSSLITIIGTKLAGKPADKKHPMGYGRIEYLTAMVVAILILVAGVTSMVESIDKIINPIAASYNVVSIVLIAVAVVTKIILGIFTQARGKKYKSEALIASGKDALFDALISSSTLVGIIVSMAAGVNIDGWIGALISVVIIKAGLEILISTLGDILGRRIDSALVKDIKKDIVQEFNGKVFGVYDVYLDNYGPNRLTGSLHIEVPDTLTATDIDQLTRQIAGYIYNKYQIGITVGIYSVNVSDKEIVKLRSNISNEVLKLPGVIQVHGFHVNKEDKIINFDVVRDFKFKDIDAFQNSVIEAAKKVDDSYEYFIHLDIDYSD